jgi:hypothetical protein
MTWSWWQLAVVVLLALILLTLWQIADRVR